VLKHVEIGGEVTRRRTLSPRQKGQPWGGFPSSQLRIRFSKGREPEEGRPSSWRRIRKESRRRRVVLLRRQFRREGARDGVSFEGEEPEEGRPSSWRRIRRESRRRRVIPPPRVDFEGRERRRDNPSSRVDFVEEGSLPSSCGVLVIIDVVQVGYG